MGGTGSAIQDKQPHALEWHTNARTSTQRTQAQTAARPEALTHARMATANHARQGSSGLRKLRNGVALMPASSATAGGIAESQPGTPFHPRGGTLALASQPAWPLSDRRSWRARGGAVGLGLFPETRLSKPPSSMAAGADGEFPAWARERSLRNTPDSFNADWARVPVAVHDTCGLWPSIEQQLQARWLPLTSEQKPGPCPPRGHPFSPRM